MKLHAYLAATIFCISSGVLTGCSDDKAPDITLNGDAHLMNPKGTAYSDPGATASDNKDESVYVISDVATATPPKNPDVDVVGDYTITYTAQDRAGNTSTITRVVSVTHTMWQFDAHNYNVWDTCLSCSPAVPALNYVSSVNVDTDYVYRTYFTNVMNFFSGSTYMDPVGNHVTIPKQTPDSLFSPFTIEGSGTVSESAGVITINVYYTFRDTTGVFYPAPLQRHATFVSF